MPSRSLNLDRNCEYCFLPREVCLCSEARSFFEPFQKTKVLVILHVRELKLPTNTARLLGVCLENFQIKLRGLQALDRPEQRFNAIHDISEAYENLFLFPTEKAEVLTTEMVEKIQKPIKLIVPDGNWKNCSKVFKRELLEGKVRPIKLVPTELSRYRLRKGPRPECLCTFEAVTEALRIIEPNLKLSQNMKKIFEIFVNRKLKAKGIHSI